MSDLALGLGLGVLSLVGAIGIGTVFTQLMFQNISNSTYIYIGWLALGVVVFVLYRKHRNEPLWERLEEPPPRAARKPRRRPM